MLILHVNLSSDRGMSGGMERSILVVPYAPYSHLIFVGLGHWTQALLVIMLGAHLL